MKSSIIELVERLFKARDLAHLRHLRTESYSEHVALQEYYEEIIPLIDKLVEATQGLNRELFKQLTIEGTQTDEVEIIQFLDDTLYIMKDIHEYRAIDNIIDDIATLHTTTLYKLRFLK